MHIAAPRPESWLRTTRAGLYCEPGGFYIDPVVPVPRAVITHGHGDHARPGNAAVLATPETIVIMQHRYGAEAGGSLQALGYGEALSLDATGRWALLKLVTGSLRVGVSARLAKLALAEWSGADIARIEEVWHGLAPPYPGLFAWLEGRATIPDTSALPTFCPL